MNIFNQVRFIIVISLLFISSIANSQSFKDKLKSKIPKKDNSAIYECGYVHKVTLAEKASPMRLLQKGLGSAVTNSSNSNLGSTSISVFYQAHLHPQSIMKFPTKIPGWETCGDAVFASFTNRNGIGLSSTDGQILMDGQEILYSDFGTYFQGFKPENRGKKNMVITSSDGDKVEFSLDPGASLEILSIDGKAKGEEIIIDGSKDIVIELSNGDADPKSKLHVQLICKLVGTPIIFDILVTRAKNTIIIPKESFKNFEGSPSPFSKTNTLMVNRVTENLLENTSAGAIRTISAYMDWAPVKMAGDLAKGNVMTMGFDTTKITAIDINMVSEGRYNFKANKAGPYNSPPLNQIKNIAVASFIVRGNLLSSETNIEGDWIVETKKWFPEISDDTWQKLADNLYLEFESSLEREFDLNILPLDKVLSTEAYKHTKTIIDGATKSFVEVGAAGTKRILTSAGQDVLKDLSISFPADFVSERLIQELDVDAVLAVTIDLNFNFETEGLDPTVNIVAFAPNISYKTSAKYYSMTANTKALSLNDSKKFTGGVDNVLYQMIHGDILIKEYIQTLKKLSAAEDANPVYEKLWKAKL